MDEHHDGTINSVPATDGAATVGQHDSPSPEHQQGIVEHDVASEQATVPYEDIEVVAAEDAEVVDDPRMRVLCDMHNEMMSIMDSLTYQPQLYPKAQHIASTLCSHEDLPTMIRVHALMVLGVAEDTKNAKASTAKVPVGKEAMKQAVGLLKEAVEAGALGRDGVVAMIAACLQSMGVENVPAWAKLGEVEAPATESS